MIVSLISWKPLNYLLRLKKKEYSGKYTVILIDSFEV